MESDRRFRSLILATENENKVREFSALLGGRLKIISLKEKSSSFSLPPEGENSYEENARQKAFTVGTALHSDALGDDSGFEVEALGLRPGVVSARYGAEGPRKLAAHEQRALILRELAQVRERRARFVSVLSFYDLRRQRTVEFRGEVYGTVALTERGEGGFGYDSLFVPDSYLKTFAEMDEAQKNAISHRAVALKLFLQWLDKT